MKKKNTVLSLFWAYKRLRWYVKTNCIDFDAEKSGDLQYVLKRYFEILGIKKPNKRAGILAIQEYNRATSPIYRGRSIPGLTLQKKKGKRRDYKRYISSLKWKNFKQDIIDERGASCEECRKPCDKLDLHHKTYDRLFNEGREDVVLLCRSCHEKVHGRKFT